MIVTADDFGLNPEVNEAVVRAHTEGILTCTSLMVGAPAAADAVEQARKLPGLGVGLHLTLVDGLPTLPRDALPGLLDTEGRLPGDLWGAGFRMFLRPAQVAREIRAQFEAFRRTSLALDHVNAHHHMHLHPTVSALMIEIGAEYGLRSVRLPSEPSEVVARAGGSTPTGFLGIWIAILRRRLLRAGLRCNDHMLGLAWTGDMTEARFLSLLPHMPPGVVELYCHPGAQNEELQALLSPRVAEEIRARGLPLLTFSQAFAR